MPTRLVHLVIDAADPGRLARFWAAALGWEVAEGRGGGCGGGVAAGLPLPRSGRAAAGVPGRARGQDGQEPGAPGPGHRIGCASGGPGRSAARPGRGARRHRPGRRALEGDGRPRGERVLRPGPAARVSGDRAGRGGRGRLPRSGRYGRVLGAGQRMGAGQLDPGWGVAAFAGRRRAVPGTAAVGGGEDGQEPRAPGRGSRAWRGSGGRGGGAARGRAVPADVGQGSVSWIVLTDPEGSEFCLLSPQ